MEARQQCSLPDGTLELVVHGTPFAGTRYADKVEIHFPRKIYKSALSCGWLLSSRHFTNSSGLGHPHEKQNVPSLTSHLILSRIRKLGLSPEPRQTRLLMASVARSLNLFLMLIACVARSLHLFLNGQRPQNHRERTPLPDSNPSPSTNAFTISWKKASTDSDSRPVQSIFFTWCGTLTAPHLESGTLQKDGSLVSMSLSSSAKKSLETSACLLGCFHHLDPLWSTIGQRSPADARNFLAILPSSDES